MLKITAKRIVRSVLDRFDVLLNNRGYANRFQDTFNQKKWGKDVESVSGEGSTLERTEAIRRELPGLCEELNVRKFIDAPCGDFYWMKTVPLQLDWYLGLDIVPEIINKNNELYGKKPGIQFEVRDIIAEPLPAADLILVRDLIIHLSLSHIRAVLQNIKASGTPWLLVTHNPTQDYNRDIPSGPGCRNLNLMLPPFHFPEPRKVIVETPVPGHEPACVALWHRDQIPV